MIDHQQAIKIKKTKTQDKLSTYTDSMPSIQTEITKLEIMTHIQALHRISNWRTEKENDEMNSRLNIMLFGSPCSFDTFFACFVAWKNDDVSEISICHWFVFLSTLQQQQCQPPTVFSIHCVSVIPICLFILGFVYAVPGPVPSWMWFFFLISTQNIYVKAHTF